MLCEKRSTPHHSLATEALFSFSVWPHQSLTSLWGNISQLFFTVSFHFIEVCEHYSQSSLISLVLALSWSLLSNMLTEAWHVALTVSLSAAESDLDVNLLGRSLLERLWHCVVTNKLPKHQFVCRVHLITWLLPLLCPHRKWFTVTWWS